jgi:hypothetical protein
MGCICGYKALQQRPKGRGGRLWRGYYNYFIRNDPSRWATNVQRYREVWVKGVYEGIDIRYYTEGGRLRFDWVVKPGAEPSQIALVLEGDNGTYLGEDGRLVFQTRFGEVALADLKAYQGSKVVESWFVQRGALWGVEVGAYDPREVLVMDPLVYSTYLGGNGQDMGDGIAVDAHGHAYVTGRTNSTDFPRRGPYRADPLGDAFVTKLSPSGDALVYSTYLGGNEEDIGDGIAVDENGHAYVTGYTFSNNFPTQKPYQGTNGGLSDVFVTRLSLTGDALVYSTYWGGNESDWGDDIAVDEKGHAYVTGRTDSPDFPAQGSYQKDRPGHDVFVTKLRLSDASGSFTTPPRR